MKKYTIIMALIFLAGICVLGLCMMPSNAKAANYTFTLIQDVTDWGYFQEYPLINNQGTVYFRAAEPVLPDADDMLLYVKPYYGTMSTYIWSHTATLQPVVEPVMNGNSRVAFRWATDDGIALSRVPGSPKDMVLSAQIDDISSLGDVNDSGHIVFRGEEDGKHGIYKCTSALNFELVVEEDGTTTDVKWPSINDNGEIYYTATLLSGANQIRTNLGIVATAPGDFDMISRASINNSGTVAFITFKSIPTPEWGIYTGGAGGTPTPYVTTVLPNMVFHPDINNNGQVAYVAETGSETGIFAGPNPATDKVIAIDDPLDGSIVDGFFVRQFNGHFFNDYGQVVFYASLVDGRQGFYRADPEGLELPREGTVGPSINYLLLEETP